MEKLVLLHRGLLHAVADAQVDLLACGDACRGLLVLHQCGHEPESFSTAGAAVIWALLRVTAHGGAAAVGEHQRVGEEVGAALGLLRDELVGRAPRVLLPLAPSAGAALEVQRRVCETAIHPVAARAREGARLVRALVLSQRVLVWELPTAFIAEHGRLAPRTHAVLAPALPVAFAPLVCRKIAFVLVVAALGTLAGHLARGGASPGASLTLDSEPLFS